MITVKTLRRGVGKYWDTKAPDGLPSVEILAWHMAAELSSFIELNMEPEDLPVIAPASWDCLWGYDAWLKERGQLPPHEMAHLLLMVNRLNAGLTARGDDTVREPTEK